MGEFLVSIEPCQHLMDGGLSVRMVTLCKSPIRALINISLHQKQLRLICKERLRIDVEELSLKKKNVIQSGYSSSCLHGLRRIMFLELKSYKHYAMTKFW